MEKFKTDSIKLQEVLTSVEASVQQYISAITKLKSDQHLKFKEQIDGLNDEIEKAKIEIECDEAAISFIKSSLANCEQDKENLASPKRMLHSKLQKYREYAEKFSQNLRFYEKRLGLSLKKLEDNTLWISFHYITPENQGEHSTVLKVEAGVYVLISCTPLIASSQELVNSLNQDNNFSKFLKNLRMAFKNLY